MKKHLAIILTLALALGGLAACGAGGGPSEKPTDAPDNPGWESIELNEYASIQIDPAVASLQEEGVIAANDNSWSMSVEFQSDETLFSFVESMLEGQSAESIRLGAFDYQKTEMDDDGAGCTYYVAKPGLKGLYGFLVLVEAKTGTPMTDAQAIISTLVRK